MTIEYFNNKWWRTVGEGYPPKELENDDEAFELIKLNNLQLTNDSDSYKCYEK